MNFSSQICAQCLDKKNLVTPDNGFSLPDVDAKIVSVHTRCVTAWIQKQSGRPSTAAVRL
jgi:hypothetical protein